MTTLAKLVLLAIVIATAWFGLTRYTQPLSLARSADPVREFLESAVSGDSAALHRLGEAQPVHWAMAAACIDSAAVREWTRNRGPVQTRRSADTTWITMRRGRSTPRCGVTSFLTAALLESDGREQLVRLSASCPAVPSPSAVPGS